jgi:hypothetical protein
MNEFQVIFKQTEVDPKVRAQILSRVYAEILSWPYPRMKKADDQPDQNTVSDSERESPSDTDPLTRVHNPGCTDVEN